MKKMKMKMLLMKVMLVGEEITLTLLLMYIIQDGVIGVMVTTILGDGITIGDFHTTHIIGDIHTTHIT